jgi:hypothetical protein
VIGWILRRWQRRFPAPVLAVSFLLLLAGFAALGWWVWRDLSRGMLLRPAIAVIALAVLSMRIIATFKPNRPQGPFRPRLG